MSPKRVYVDGRIVLPDILETDERIEMPAKAEIRKTFMIN